MSPDPVELPAELTGTGTLIVAGDVSIQEMIQGKIQFTGRPYADAMDPMNRLCRFMWALADKGDPEVLALLAANEIEIIEADGTKVAP